jgi:hypothetical protein
MDRDSMIAPGPIVWRMPFIPLGGASGISLIFHGSNAPALINCSAIISLLPLRIEFIDKELINAKKKEFHLLSHARF